MTHRNKTVNKWQIVKCILYKRRGRKAVLEITCRGYL